ncbi:MAG: ABC transporter substrate-binding protein [Planctomycetota bacterium]|jgi:peptide/nickel transport system substrate-binding protein|nr:ABC transporter substrate-binding protein [Planctomycetota bacterium]
MRRHLLAACLVALTAAILIVPDAKAEDLKKGGVLNIATIAEPPTLDPTATTADVVGMITQHYYETLYAFGHGFAVKPLLASAMPDVSDGGKVYTIRLRQGVKFHNGKEMTSADAAASVKRWFRDSVRGKQIANLLVDVSAPDKYTVKIQMSAPHTPLLALLAIPTSMAIIIPEELCEGDLKENIGTGPYKFAEHQPDRYIRLVRNDDYSPSPDAADLYAGARVAYADELRFIPVPSANTRLEGALAGQYQYSDQLPIENYDRLVGVEKVEPVMTDPYGWPILFLNCREGKMTNLAMRRAVQAAMSQEDMMYIAFGEEEFFSVDGALYPEGYFYNSKKGLELYNQYDIEKARKLLKDANYDGSPVRILTSMQYEFHFKMAQVLAENLREAGMEVAIDVVDWATLTQQRTDPLKWDLYFTHSPFVPDPYLNNFFNDEYPGWWIDAKKTELANKFNSEPDLKKRAEIFGDIQQLLYESASSIKIGNFNLLAAQDKNLKGYLPSSWPSFWNVAIE